MLAHPPASIGIGHAGCQRSIQCICLLLHMEGPKTSHEGTWALSTWSVCLPYHSTVVAFSGTAHLLTCLMPVEGGCDSSPSANVGPFCALGLPSALFSPEGILRLEGAICFFIRSCLPIRSCPVRVILIHITCASPEPLQVSSLLPTAAVMHLPSTGNTKNDQDCHSSAKCHQIWSTRTFALRADDYICYSATSTLVRSGSATWHYAHIL